MSPHDRHEEKMRRHALNYSMGAENFKRVMKRRRREAMSVTHVIAVEVMTADSMTEEHVIEAVRDGLAMTIDFDDRGLRLIDVRPIEHGDEA